MVKAISLALLVAATLAVADPTVYLIRHGEKPDDGDGLSSQGEQRAQCLPNVFGSSSSYDIGHIMAQTPKDDGGRQRPLDTVQPLADSLGLTVDTSCDRDDPGCVKDVVTGYTGSGNILICWEHDALHDIVKKLGADDAPDYGDDEYVVPLIFDTELIANISSSFDIIWTDPSPYDSITSKDSENCPGLDD